MTAAERPPADMTLQRSSRDASDVPARLAQWLAGRLPEGADPQVVLRSGIDANGMSSETLLLDVTWTEDGRPRTAEYVARVAPAAHDFPIFPRYDLPGQHDLLRLVAARTGVPVPAVRHLEPTGDVLGTPFFLMDRVAGQIPPDVLPYNFGDSWLALADPADQRRLQDATVRTIAACTRCPPRRCRTSTRETGAVGWGLFEHGALGRHDPSGFTDWFDRAP